MFSKALVSLKNNRKIQFAGSMTHSNSFPMIKIFRLYRGAISGDNTIEAYERLHRAQAQLQELEDESTFWSEKLRLLERGIDNTLNDITLRE